ncbi:MAG: hypothetical protein AAFU56_05755 [Pseudomonadota bacterium]
MWLSRLSPMMDFLHLCGLMRHQTLMVCKGNHPLKVSEWLRRRAFVMSVIRGNPLRPRFRYLSIGPLGFPVLRPEVMVGSQQRR